MKTVEQVLKFFTDKLAVETATADDIIGLEQFCRKLDDLAIEEYVNSLSIDDVSQLDKLKKLIWECSKQLLLDWHKYEEMLELESGTFDEGSVEDLEDQKLFFTIQLSELERIKNTFGHLDAPYEYVSSDGVVESTTDIDVAIQEAARQKDEADIYKYNFSMLQRGVVSDTIKEFKIKRDVSLKIIEQYLKMESTVFKATRIRFDSIVEPLSSFLNDEGLFDKPIGRDSLVGLLNLSDNYRVYKIKSGKKVYVYALLRIIEEKMSGDIATSRDMKQWLLKAIDYFDLADYHTKHKNDYLTRNEGPGGVIKFNEEMNNILESCKNKQNI